MNAVVLGVSMDDEESHKSFCAKESLNFRLLADTKKTVCKSYNSTAMMGIIAARNTFLIAPDGKIAKVYLGVNPASHSEALLADLSALSKK